VGSIVSLSVLVFYYYNEKRGILRWIDESQWPTTGGEGLSYSIDKRRERERERME
jgi:hypothetical protein